MKTITKSLILLLFIFEVLYSQQPIGVTKNAIENAGGIGWHVGSEGEGYDGYTGGSIFIDNYPYVGIDQRESYWVAGRVKFDHGADYHETLFNETYNSCFGTGTIPVYNPIGSRDKVALSSVLFQLFYSDFFRLGRDVTDRRFQFSNIMNGGTIYARGDNLTTNELPDNSEVRYIVAYVKQGDEIGDDRIRLNFPSRTSGLYIYYEIYDASGIFKHSEKPLDHILAGVLPKEFNCYRQNDLTLSKSLTDRVYIGSDSHGNLQNWEPSLTELENKFSTGELDCSNSKHTESKPTSMKPLLGDIYRTLFVQGVLQQSDIDGFFNNPHTYLPTSGVKFDFPSYITNNPNGYSIVIPNSHWRAYDNIAKAHVLQQKLFHYPGCQTRQGLHIEYSGMFPREYGIKYSLVSRMNEDDRVKYDRLSFYLGDDDDTNYDHDFSIFIKLTLTDKLNPSDDDTKQFYIQASPNISATTLDGNYLNVRLEPNEFANGNSYYDHYQKDLKELIATTSSLTGYTKIKSLDEILMRGAFDIGGIVLSKSNYTPIAPKVQEDEGTAGVLLTNYPNPFNPITNISFELNDYQHVKLDIYNTLGQHIQQLCDLDLSPGFHSFKFNGTDLSSGLYICNLKADKKTYSKKLVLLK